MVLYNTTFIVDTHAIDSFKAWVSTSYIPKALDSGIFEQPLLTRVLLPEGMEADNSATSFAVQFKSSDHEAAQLWNAATAPELIAPLIRQHGPEAVLSFSTFMEIL